MLAFGGMPRLNVLAERPVLVPIGGVSADVAAGDRYHRDAEGTPVVIGRPVSSSS